MDSQQDPSEQQQLKENEKNDREEFKKQRIFQKKQEQLRRRQQQPKEQEQQPPGRTSEKSNEDKKQEDKAQEHKAQDDETKKGNEESEKSKAEREAQESEDQYARLSKSLQRRFDAMLASFERILSDKTPEKMMETSGDKIWTNMSYLYQYYGDMSSFKMTEQQMTEYRSLVSIRLSQSEKLLAGICSLAVHLYTKHADDLFVAADSDQAGEFKRDLAILQFIMASFHNYSDSSWEFGLTLSKIDSFFVKFVNDSLVRWLKLQNDDDYPVINHMVMSSLGLVYNLFFKNNSQVYDNLTKLNVVEHVKPYLQIPDVQVQLQALVLIAFALDESHADLYLGAKEVIQHLIEQLDKSLKDPERRSSGYHVVELAACTNRLALNDVNKKLLVELQLLPVLARMCAGGKEDEVASALDILFTLSFDEGNKQAILEQFGEQLRSLYKDETPRGSCGELWRKSRSLQGLDFNLNEELSNPSKGRPKTARQLMRRTTKTEEQLYEAPPEGAHVMISYQHESKEQVVRIKEALCRANIKVWIDYEHMLEGSTLGLMADAVESAHAFLMCMSRKYKESNNCRQEAEYAWKTGKRVVPLLMEYKYSPDGWLGMMLGLKLYYDFSGKYPFETKMEQLLKVLADRGELASEETVSKTTAGKAGARPPSPGGREHHLPSPYTTLPPIGPKSSNVRDWTAEKTREWASQKQLEEEVKQSGIAGEELHFLLVCRSRAPEAFYRLAERLLQPAGGDARLLARFVNALEEM